MAERYLSIYMNDQLALGVGWRELARRAQKQNSGTELGAALARVAEGIAEDVRIFESLMRRLGIKKSRIKLALATLGERAGRLKLNGRLTSYSALSRFDELDFLVMGIEGKKILWGNLKNVAALEPELTEVDFDELVRRAEEQRADLEPFRVESCRRALAPARHLSRGRPSSIL